jgi:hypothetical protein
MTQGELRFYLREIHSYWCTAHIAEERIVELHAAKLIERSADAIAMIRLTNEGAKEKAASRPHKGNSTLSLVRKPDRSRQRQRHSKKPTKAQRLS